MSKVLRKLLVWGSALAVVAALALLIAWRLMEAEEERRDEEAGPAPVEVAPIERGRIEDRRTFSGTLVPRAQFIVAPKVSGRVREVRVDVGDKVAPGATVAVLDGEEFAQAVAQAEAELEVTKAELAQARSALEIARREHERIRTLQERNIASASAFDAAEADLRAKEAGVAVAQAQVQRAEAALGTERVRLGYVTVAASWAEEGAAERLVSERFVDAGATVAANDPIVTVVDLSSVRAVMFVTEREYARLHVGQPATVRTDAFPNQVFDGAVTRLSPVFEEASRQARVEIEVPNQGGRLKAGMYVRATVVLDAAEDATIVPAAAIARREGREGVFVLPPGASGVKWVLVRPGIVSDGRMQLLAEAPLEGDVVVLGQQLLDDGGAVAATRAAAPVQEPAPR